MNNLEKVILSLGAIILLVTVSVGCVGIMQLNDGRVQTVVSQMIK